MSKAWPSRLNRRWSSGAKTESLCSGRQGGRWPGEHGPGSRAPSPWRREAGVRRLQAERIEDDLHRLHVRMLEGQQGLIDRLHAHPVVAHLARRHEVVQEAEHVVALVECGGRAVELEQIHRLHLEVPEAALHPRDQVLPGVALHGLPGQAAAGLGGHEDDVAGPLPAQARDEPLAPTVPVDVGGVDEVGAGLHRGVKRLQGLGVVHRAPASADGPAPEADRGDVEARAPEGSVFHACSRGAILRAITIGENGKGAFMALTEKLETLPLRPGVYLFKDADGDDPLRGQGPRPARPRPLVLPGGPVPSRSSRAGWSS